MPSAMLRHCFAFAASLPPLRAAACRHFAFAAIIAARCRRAAIMP